MMSTMFQDQACPENYVELFSKLQTAFKPNGRTETDCIEIVKRIIQIQSKFLTPPKKEEEEEEQQQQPVIQKKEVIKPKLLCFVTHQDKDDVYSLFIPSLCILVEKDTLKTISAKLDALSVSRNCECFILHHPKKEIESAPELARFKKLYVGKETTDPVELHNYLVKTYTCMDSLSSLVLLFC